jgi:hypothetical protein
MAISANLINSIIPNPEDTKEVKPALKPEQEQPVEKKEAIPSQEKPSTSKVSTIEEKPEQPSMTTIAPVKKPGTPVVDQTKTKTILHPVPDNAEPETKALDKEEAEFIGDVEAAHGNK